MAEARAPGPLARYLQVAHALQRSIAAQHYPVGTLIPTEAELAASFGVSRQTVRQAIAQLRAGGVLSARKGVGTRVEAPGAGQGYHHAVQSLTELFRFAQETVFRVERTERVAATGALAALLACKAGRPWLRLEGVREPAAGGATLGAMTVYVDARYADLLAAPRVHATALFSQIERHHGEAIGEVRQEVEATLLDADAARRLDAPAGGPALLVTRRYYGAGHRLVELSRTLHPADRFRHVMTLRRR